MKGQGIAAEVKRTIGRLATAEQTIVNGGLDYSGKSRNVSEPLDLTIDEPGE